MQRYGAQDSDVLSGKATTEIRAVLAELRLRARDHLSAAKQLMSAASPELMPALLPLALVRTALDRMERRNYDPFTRSDLPQWRRQWRLWRAARKGIARAL
jgi:phytoene synthase